MSEDKLPKALFNSKALFNPYQYEPFGKILKWDEEAKEYKWNGKNLLITDEVGVGKTFEVGIILSEILRHNPDYTALIICPNKLCINWENELYEKFYIPCKNYDKEKNFGQCTVVPYSYFEKSEEDYEDLEYDVLILDEAHYVRNDGTRLDNIKNIIETNAGNQEKLKIFMTGTPIFNTDNDYSNLTQLLNNNYEVTKTLQSEANCYDDILRIYLWGNKINEEHTQRYSQNKYIETSNEENEIIKEIYSGEYGNLTGYLKKIASSSFYALKQFVESKESQKNMIEELDGTEEYTDIKLENLKKATDSWKDDSKLTALKKLLENLQGKEESNEKFKAIIFSHFLTTIDYLANELGSNDDKSYITYKLNGSMPTAKAREIIKAFENEKKPAVLLCSDAFKEGQNLQFCHYLIHYDLPFTPAEIGQRNGRIYRKGQERKPEVYYLLLEKGYDLRIFAEIILGKCMIIEREAYKGKLSALNIMPWDAEKLIGEAVDRYIDEYLKEDEKTDEKEKIKKFLKKHFSKKNDENEITWLNEEAKQLHDLEEVSKNEIKEFYKKSIIMPKSDENGEINKEMKGLSEIYRKRYNEKVKNFIKNYINDSIDEGEAEQVFKNECDKYLNKLIEDRKEEYKFCNDMTGDTQIDIETYIDKFQPLERVMDN